MDVVAVINQKGGVGKTTTTVNLGCALAEMGRHVLLIDLDPQANLGTHLGVDIVDGSATVYEVLTKDIPLTDALIESREERVSVVPSHLDLSAAEMELVSRVGRETILRDSLEALERAHPGHFDTVLLDCPPSLGILTINALSAAQKVLVPLQAEFFALQGMAKLNEIIELIRRRLNPSVELAGIVACKVDSRTRLTHEVLGEVRRFFPDRLMDTSIRPNVKLAEAPSFGQSVLSYAPYSNGAEDYRRLALEWTGNLPAEEEAPAEDEEEFEDEDGDEGSTESDRSVDRDEELSDECEGDVQAAASESPNRDSAPESASTDRSSDQHEATGAATHGHSITPQGPMPGDPPLSAPAFPSPHHQPSPPLPQSKEGQFGAF